MKKFAFIGAGSFIFTRNLVRDLLSFPAFEDCELALMDTDPERLESLFGSQYKVLLGLRGDLFDVISFCGVFVEIR